MYKWTDADGNVHYSDEPHPDAVEVQPPSLNAIPMPKPLPKPEPAAEMDTPVFKYKKFSLVAPTNEETVRNNAGVVTLQLALEPKLASKEGHTISVYLDNRRVVKKSTGLTIAVEGVERGSHSLRAAVVDKKGKVVTRTKLIQFHMRRQGISSTNKARHPGPLDAEGNSILPGPRGVLHQPGPLISTATSNDP